MAMTNEVVSSVSFETIQNAVDYAKALISEGYPVTINPMLEKSLEYPFEMKVGEYIVCTNSKKGSQFSFTVVGNDENKLDKAVELLRWALPYVETLAENSEMADGMLNLISEANRFLEEAE